MELTTVLKIFAVVIGVQSGDTIIVSVDGQERALVLAGIAAPQEGQAYFEQARDCLADKVKGKKIFIQVFGKNNGGLETAAVWLDKRSINAEMVADGLAWYNPRHPEYKTIADAQEQAKTKKLGLWADEKPIPPWEFSQASQTAKPTGQDSSSQSLDIELGDARELAHDDGKPAGKRSLPQGFAVMFETPAGEWYLTSVRVHGARYGLPQPPEEDMHLTLCDRDYMPIKNFTFPYAKFKRSENSDWVTLSVPPTKLSEKFVLCLNFNAERTKGVYVSHDAEGTGLVGLPDKPGGFFSGGDWLIRPTIRPHGPVPSAAAAKATDEKKSEEPAAVEQTAVPKLGEAKELSLDDGKPAGKKSFPLGHAAKFESPDGDWWLTSIRIHGSRYGLPQPPREDFHVTMCDPQFKPIRDFPYSYAKFKRSADCKWVTLNIPPTKVPKEFVITLNFNAERTKGVYISHDAEGTALVGLPDKPRGQFTGGNWLIRPTLRPAE